MGIPKAFVKFATTSFTIGVSVAAKFAASGPTTSWPWGHARSTDPLLFTIRLDSFSTFSGPS